MCNILEPSERLSQGFGWSFARTAREKRACASVRPKKDVVALNRNLLLLHIQLYLNLLLALFHLSRARELTVTAGHQQERQTRDNKSQRELLLSYVI